MKYSEELTDKIAALVADGMSPTRAGVLLDVSAETISEWRKSKPDFSVKIERGKAKFVQRLLARIEIAGEKDWKANMALLERLEPAEFGLRTSVRVETPDLAQGRKTAHQAMLADPAFLGFLRDEAKVIAAKIERGQLPALPLEAIEAG